MIEPTEGDDDEFWLSKKQVGFRTQCLALAVGEEGRVKPVEISSFSAHEREVDRINGQLHVIGDATQASASDGVGELIQQLEAKLSITASDGQGAAAKVRRSRKVQL